MRVPPAGRVVNQGALPVGLPALALKVELARVIWVRRIPSLPKIGFVRRFLPTIRESRDARMMWDIMIQKFP